MNYLKNIFDFSPSWLSSQRQNIFFLVAISVVTIAIIFIIMQKNKAKADNPKHTLFAAKFNGYSDENFESAFPNVASDAKFKVAEEILQTDSKNIIE